MFQKNERAISKIITSNETPKNGISNSNIYLSKKYNSYIEKRNKTNKNKNSNKINNKKNLLFNTQKINNYNLNELLEGYSSDTKIDMQNEKNKKYESIQQYEYVNNHTNVNLKKNNGKNINKKILEKKNYYTHDERKKNKRNTNNRLISNHLLNKNINDDLYNSKYNSLSNILKNKKMISTPVLDSNFNNEIFDLQNYTKNSDDNDNNNVNKINNTQNENDINGKNKNNIEVVDKSELMLDSEIEKIKKEILNLKANNNILLNKLKEEKNKNISLTSFNNAENENIPNDNELHDILTDIANYLQVNTFEDIIPKLKEMIEYLNTNIYEKNDKSKKRNELISKLQELYMSLNNKTNTTEQKEHVSIKVIWRWIKYLMNSYKSLLNEKEKKIEIFNNLNEKDNYYRESCIELMNKYKMNSLEDLNSFIEELIKRNNINRKRVEQLKKILVDDSNSNRNNNEKKLNLIMSYKRQKNDDIKFNKNY